MEAAGLGARGSGKVLRSGEIVEGRLVCEAVTADMTGWGGAEFGVTERFKSRNLSIAVVERERPYSGAVAAWGPDRPSLATLRLRIMRSASEKSAKSALGMHRVFSQVLEMQRRLIGGG